MTIKAIVDAARALPGYAGIGILSGTESLFLEHIEIDYALRLESLYVLLRENGAGYESMCAVAGSFTFHVYCDGDLTIVVRLAGRFCPRPGLVSGESDYVDPLAPDTLPSREEVRREAEALLKHYDLLS